MRTQMIQRKKRQLAGWIGVLAAVLLCLGTAGGAQAQEVPVQDSMTNLVAVVDCSTSMQSSDSTWQVPEALNLLIDMCPDEADIRFSLIAYGTESVVEIQDIPLNEQGKLTVKEALYAALQGYGYNRGQTDTGAAMTQVRGILEGRGSQNNRVLLFTDGAVKAEYYGRTTEISRAEIADFIAFAQEQAVTVDVFGLFNKAVSEEELALAEEDLKRLSLQSGGQYQRVEDIATLPGCMETVLAEALDVRSYAMEQGAQTEYNGQTAWSYPFRIESGLQESMSFILPQVERPVSAVLLRSPAGAVYEVASGIEAVTGEQVLPGANWTSYTRYNGRPGYCVAHLSRVERGEWIGDWELLLVTPQTEAPAVQAFYIYDVQIRFEMENTDCNVMKPVTVEFYLTTGDGLRVDDLDFLNSLDAQIRIVNANSRKARTAELEEPVEDAEEDVLVADRLQLFNDSFVYQFTPQFVSSYYFVASIGNDTLTRQATTQTFDVTDDLVTVCRVKPAIIQKRVPFTISGYMLQKSDNSRVDGTENYYSYCDAYAIIEQTDVFPRVRNKVQLRALEDGSGFAAEYTLDREGEYEITVYTDSSQERLTNAEKAARVVEGVSTRQFTIEDRPLRVSLLQPRTYLRMAGMEDPIDLSGMFYDADGDWYTLSCTDDTGAAVPVDADEQLAFTAPGRGTYRLHVRATDFQGEESVETELKVIVIEIWQAVLMLIGGMALVCVLLYVAAWLICRRTAIHGLMRVSVAWNRWPDGRSPEGVDAPLMENGSYLISMTDPPGLEAEDRFIGTLSFWDRIKPRRYSVAKLLDRYRHCYECAGFYNDAADNLLSDLERNLVDLGTLRGSFDGKSFTVSRDKGRQCKVRAAGKKNSGGKVTAYTVCRELEPRYGDRDGFLAKNICITIEYLDQSARTAGSGKTEVGK